MDARRNLLKMYVLSLLADGQLAGARSLARLLDAVTKSLTADLQAVSGEILGLIVASEGRRISDAVKKKVEKIADSAAQRFAQEGLSAALGGLWVDMKRAVFPEATKK